MSYGKLSVIPVETFTGKSYLLELLEGVHVWAVKTLNFAFMVTVILLHGHEQNKPSGKGSASFSSHI